MVIEAQLPMLDLTEKTIPAPPKPLPETKGCAGKSNIFKGGRLKNAVVDELKLQYGMWLGLPVSARAENEKTLKDFSKKLGINENTLTEWKGDALVQETAMNALKIFGGNKKLDIINKIVEQALAGEYQQQRIYMEWQGEIGVRVMDKESRKPKSVELTLVTDMPKQEDKS